jgi:bifunctional N-acetylglucosamine-1-phosphate-uridyltransferase/glucosamine-1-phosphate-acetyltransferase GlmU-like protein
MIYIDEFIDSFPKSLVKLSASPWLISITLPDILPRIIEQPGKDYVVNQNVAVHKTATVEPGAIIKGCAIIGPHCFVAANAYLRGAIYLHHSVVIGPACEVKNSVIMDNTHLAHFNFVGDSLIGSHVNFEAGAIVCNYWNERPLKEINLFYNQQIVETGVEKFGAIVGDQCKIGANAVLSPGTILAKNTVVNRLQLVEQNL